MIFSTRQTSQWPPLTPDYNFYLLCQPRLQIILWFESLHGQIEVRGHHSSHLQIMVFTLRPAVQPTLLPQHPPLGPR